MEKKVSGTRRRRSQLQMLEEDSVKIGSPKKTRRSEPEPEEDKMDTEEEEEVESTQEAEEPQSAEEVTLPAEEQAPQQAEEELAPVPEQASSPVSSQPTSPLSDAPPGHRRTTSRFFRQPGETADQYLARLTDEGVRRRRGLPPAPLPVYVSPAPSAPASPADSASYASVQSTPADRGEVVTDTFAAEVAAPAEGGQGDIERALCVGFYTLITCVAFGLSLLASSSWACSALNTYVTSLASSLPFLAGVQMECTAMNAGAWALLNIGVFALGSSVVANMYKELDDRALAMQLSQRFCQVVFSMTCFFAMVSAPALAPQIPAKELWAAVLLAVFSFTMADVTLFHPFSSTFATLKSVVTFLGVGSALVSIHTPALIPNVLGFVFNLEYSEHMFNALLGLLSAQFMSQMGEFARVAGMAQEEYALYVLARLVGLASLVILPYGFFQKDLFPALAVTTVLVTDFFFLVVDAYTAETARIHSE